MTTDSADLNVAREVISFWQSAGPAKWFAKDDAFDKEISDRFEPLIAQAESGALDDWRQSKDGLLALILLLDQFPRNLYRGSAQAFRYGDMAVSLTEHAIASGLDTQIALPLRTFIYLPFEHAEDMVLQDRCVALCRAAGDDDGLKWAIQHADVIRRFGRFPHRNAVLGRESTEDELRFLTDGGFAG